MTIIIPDNLPSYRIVYIYISIVVWYQIIGDSYPNCRFNSATYMCHIWRAFFGNQLTEVRDGCLFFWHCWPQLLFTIVSVWKSGDFWWLIYKYIDNSFGNPTYTPTTLTKEDILDNHRSVLCSFGVSTKLYFSCFLVQSQYNVIMIVYIGEDSICW